MFIVFTTPGSNLIATDLMAFVLIHNFQKRKELDIIPSG